MKRTSPALRALIGALLFASFVNARAVAGEDLAAVLSKLESQAARADLAARLKADPIRTLEEVGRYLGAAVPADDVTGPRALRIHAHLSEIVSAAFDRATDPRVFTNAATRDECAPVVLGVVRAVCRVVERGPAPASLDQGAPPDYVEFLRSFTTFEGSAEVRRLACEALGQTPVTRATAQALVAALADEDAKVVRAATASLELLAGRSYDDAAAWRAWVTRLPSKPTFDLREVLAPDQDRRTLHGRLAQFEQALVEAPGPTLGEFARELESTPVEEQLAASLVDAIANALQQTEDLESFYEHASAGTAIVATGVARGIGRAAALHARSGEGEHPDAERMRQTLADLFRVDDVSARREAARVVPALVSTLSADWVDLLARALDDPDQGVRDAAWRSLQLISGAKLPQSPVGWRRWWDQQGAPDQTSGEPR